MSISLQFPSSDLWRLKKRKKNYYSWIAQIKWISGWSGDQCRWYHNTFLMCWCSLSPQWQSWHSARLWFPGELCVAGDDQRDRGEVGLPLQPWKPWHILWGTATVVCVCIHFVKCLFSMLDWVVSPVCVCVVSVDSLSSFLALQREHRVRAEVWASVQLAGQCEETESTPLIYQLPQQMEPARLLSAAVNIT